jgi:hypothetical protein
MTIVGGLDIHPKQLTFDYLDICGRRVTLAPAGSGWRSGSPSRATA